MRIRLRSGRSVAALFFAGACFVGIAESPAAGPRPFAFRTAARTDLPAPGTEAGTTYGDVTFPAPALNSAGQVSFYSFLQGPSADNSNYIALFAGSPGDVALVARIGTHAPGTPADVVHGNFRNQALLADSGRVAFDSQLAGPSVDNNANVRAVYTGPIGAPVLLAREGEPAPGMPPGVVYRTLQTSVTSINAPGQVSFVGTVKGPGVNVNGNAADNYSALWAGTPGNVTLVARQGDRAPGAPEGVVYDQVLSEAKLNASGQIAFGAGLTGAVSSFSNSAAFAGPLDAVQMVARAGDIAPGTGGRPFLSVGAWQINDRGDLLLTGGLATGSGVWVGQPGAFQLVALGGAHAPGTPQGVTFDIGLGNATLGRGGAVALQTPLAGAGAGASGVWAGQPGALQLIARTGDAVPGEGGVTFSDLFGYSPGAAINASGEVAFLSTLAGPGVNTSNDQAIFLADAAGTVSTVVREGDLFDVGGGVLRTVRTFNFIGADALNDAGQVAFQATFTDGSSGIFVAVPEPASAVSLALLTGVATLRRRRRSKQ